MNNPLLSIKNLRVFFQTSMGTLKAVNGIDLDIQKGKIVGLVGESGGGKSMVGLSVLRLVPEGGKIDSGEILFEERNLLTMSEEEMRSIRGADISMILQDPLSSLNPAFRIEPQMVDVWLLKKLSTDYQTSVLFITHDLGIVANLCDRVAVIYAGEIVETAQTRELFANPRHPYTRALFRSIPRHDRKQEHFYSIDGTMGTPIDWPDRCFFYPRCDERSETCEHQALDGYATCSPDHFVRCLKYS
jgi:oligopeptide/dipeptide ABC transporter ATP-binding protein